MIGYTALVLFLIAAVGIVAAAAFDWTLKHIERRDGLRD